MCVQIGHSQAQSQLPCTHLLAHPIQSTGLGRLYFQERSVLNVNGTLCDCRLAVDGPFGAALTDVFHYPVSMCIATGIGVTPFAALLKSIWYQCCESQTQWKLSKVWKISPAYPSMNSKVPHPSICHLPIPGQGFN